MTSLRRRVVNCRPPSLRKTNSKKVSGGLPLYLSWISAVITHGSCPETSHSQGISLVKCPVCQPMSVCMTIVVHKPGSFCSSQSGRGRVHLPHLSSGTLSWLNIEAQVITVNYHISWTSRLKILNILRFLWLSFYDFLFAIVASNPHVDSPEFFFFSHENTQETPRWTLFTLFTIQKLLQMSLGTLLFWSVSKFSLSDQQT